MISDDLVPDNAPWSQAEFEGLRRDVVSLRQRGVAKVSKQGTEYPALLAIARERDSTNPARIALQNLLLEGVTAIEASDDYCQAMCADYGLDKSNYGLTYRKRRAAARKQYGDVSESVWAKTQPKMADTLTEALLGLRDGKIDVPPEDDTPSGTADKTLRLWALAVFTAICLAVVSLVVSGVFEAPQSITQLGIVDATTGRLLAGAAATLHADRIGDTEHLIPNVTTLCVDSPNSLHPSCMYRRATQYVCGIGKNLTTNECENIPAPGTFRAQIGDVISFRVPLADVTPTSLPFIEMYLQSVRYAEPTNRVLVQMTAQWPSSTFAPKIPLYHLTPPTSLCPPGQKRVVCPTHPERAVFARDSESLAQLILEFPAGEEGRLNYLSDSAMLLDGKGRVVAKLPGDILDPLGISFANV